MLLLSSRRELQLSCQGGRHPLCCVSQAQAELDAGDELDPGPASPSMRLTETIVSGNRLIGGGGAHLCLLPPLFLLLLAYESAATSPGDQARQRSSLGRTPLLEQY